MVATVLVHPLAVDAVLAVLGRSHVLEEPQDVRIVVSRFAQFVQFPGEGERMEERREIRFLAKLIHHVGMAAVLKLLSNWNPLWMTNIEDTYCKVNMKLKSLK